MDSQGWLWFGTSQGNREIVLLAEFERDYILKVLKATNWRIKGVHGAAALLGLHPATLYGKMRKQGIKRPNKEHI